MLEIPSAHLCGELSQLSPGSAMQNIEHPLPLTCIHVKVMLEVCAGCAAVTRESVTQLKGAGAKRPEVTGGA